MTESTDSSTTTDRRLIQLQHWLSSQDLPVRCLPATIRPASNDASFRRYFRVTTADNASDSPTGSLILMDAPPEHEDCAPFVHAARIMRDAGLRVPVIYASDLEQGFLVLSDLGSQTLLQEVQATPTLADHRYRQSCAQLILLQRATRAGVFAPYDRDRLTTEIRLFDQWFLRRHHNMRLTGADRQRLHDCYDAIIRCNLSEAQVYVHRDYHARNLMTGAVDEAPAVIDFQDAVIGPVSYDLVSLLRDAYISWPEEQILDWCIRYWEQARDTSIPVPTDFGQFWTQFELMGMQRHLKVLGIFCRLNLRDNKPGYLADLPQVLRYASEVAARYEMLSPIRSLLSRIDELQAAGTDAERQ